MRKALALLAFVMLTGFGGCASTPTNPQQAVFAAKQSYAVALTVAVAYKRLPACAPAAPKVCSDAKVVKQLQAADNAAAALLDGAEATVRTPGAGLNAATAVKAAEQAVSAFVTITSALSTK